MLPILIYAATGFLLLWAIWYLIRHIRRQLRGGCGGDCSACSGCHSAPPKRDV